MGQRIRGETGSENFVVVYARKNHPGLEKLDEFVTHVHITGHPFLCLLGRIFELAPNVQIIRISPGLVENIARHQALCLERGVQIVYGRVDSRGYKSAASSRPRLRKSYEAKRLFFLSLSGRKKKLFDELVSLGFKEARLVLDYFGLSGEPAKSQVQIRRQKGLTLRVSTKINAALYYLDPSWQVSKTSKQAARGIKARVCVAKEKARAIRAQAREVELRRKVKNHCGLEVLPANLPSSFLSVFAQIFDLFKAGRLTVGTKAHQVLLLRFGLHPDCEPVCRTYEQIGDIIHLTRQRAKQLMIKALIEFNIVIA